MEGTRQRRRLSYVSGVAPRTRLYSNPSSGVSASSNNWPPADGEMRVLHPNPWNYGFSGAWIWQPDDAEFSGWGNLKASVVKPAPPSQYIRLVRRWAFWRGRSDRELRRPDSYVPFFGNSREFHPILGQLDPSYLVESIDCHFGLPDAFLGFIEEPI